jgi:hypothetical protein
MPLKRLVHRLRQYRSIHKWIGISVVLFMFITSTTGVFLGWKKMLNSFSRLPKKGRVYYSTIGKASIK